MKRPRQSTSRWLLAAIGLGLLAGVLIAGMASAGDDKPLPPVQPEDLPVPNFHFFINPASGKWENPGGPWDNRPILPEAKAERPWYDPRWKPFGQCMAAAGYEVRADPSRAFNQADLDAVFERLNKENPDPVANKKIQAKDQLPGFTGAFSDCAFRWLAIRSSDFEANGLRIPKPGEVP